MKSKEQIKEKINELVIKWENAKTFDGEKKYSSQTEILRWVLDGA